MEILKVFGKLGAILTIILLVVTLLRQLIAMVGILLILVKAALIIGFLVLLGLILFQMLKCKRRGDGPEEL